MKELNNYKKLYISIINNILKEENADYHIINEQITDITNEEEIKSINKTLSNKYSTVDKHFQNAIKNLYDVKDYNNSIKESISAVESTCQIMCNKDKATLGQALNLLEKEN